MNTNMIGFRCFLKSLHPCALDESSLSIERIKHINYIINHETVGEQVVIFLTNIQIMFKNNIF